MLLYSARIIQYVGVCMIVSRGFSPTFNVHILYIILYSYNCMLINIQEFFFSFFSFLLLLPKISIFIAYLLLGIVPHFHIAKLPHFRYKRQMYFSIFSQTHFYYHQCHKNNDVNLPIEISLKCVTIPYFIFHITYYFICFLFFIIIFPVFK